jgi:hypothetical protein
MLHEWFCCHCQKDKVKCFISEKFWVYLEINGMNQIKPAFSLSFTFITYIFRVMHWAWNETRYDAKLTVYSLAYNGLYTHMTQNMMS